MSTEQDRVMRIMQDKQRGTTAGRKLGYDRDTRRIIPIDEHGRPISHDPDRITAVAPEDMGHSGGDRRSAQ